MSTGADLTSGSNARPFTFEGLESFTRSEAAFWNWRQQFLGGVQDWQAWIREAWGDLLLAPAGLEISVVQTHSVDAHRQSRNYSFKQCEVFIGRDPGSDIVLDTLAAGKRHALILVENGRCFLEDLGSSLGTYWNQVRIAPNQRRLLQSGDQIAIFPHLFTVRVRLLWARQLDVGVHAGAAESMSWQRFQDTSAGGRINLPVYIHPTGAALCLEVSHSFLMEFADRLLRPLNIDAPPSTLGPTDGAFLEFLILCLIERANRDLAFPFQFETAAWGTKPAIAGEAAGVCLACSISLLAATGALRVFLPYASLEVMSRAVPGGIAKTVSAPVTWSFPVSLGSAELSAGELSGLERGDVLLFERSLELLLPHRFDCGWKLAAKSGGIATVDEIRNLNRLQIDKYFERESLTSQDPESANPPGPDSVPDLSQLPVRIHVILAEKELTFPEASGLASGTILELDCEKTGAVSLAINGKVMGQAQLVEVEGRLGVKILSWRGA